MTPPPSLFRRRPSPHHHPSLIHRHPSPQSPIRVTKWDLGSGDSAPSELSTVSMNAGENSAYAAVLDAAEQFCE